MIHPTIFSYVKSEEAAFETQEVRVADNWSWSFRNHVQLIFHLVNGVFYTGENNWMRAFKNVMDPILNLAFWSEDIEVKDIVFFIEEKTGRVLSFLVKKYHDEVYVRENDLDTFIDEITETDLTYGGVLVQRTDKGRPKVIPFTELAFCDQTDIMGGPIAFKHNFSPDKLRQMGKFGWGEEKNGATISLEELCTLAEHRKDAPGMMDTKRNETPGKNIEVYVVRGNLPEHFLKDNDNMEYYTNQLHVVAFYTDKDEKKQGVTLYRNLEDEVNLKFFTSKKVPGRALGRGEGEALLHPQIWTNFLTIHKTKMLEAASKVPLVTDDPNFHNRNKIQDMETLEITTIEEGKSITQIPTAAVANIQLFERSINEWYDHAQLTGSAFDPLLGKEPVSGTTFRGQERVVAQGRGIHDRRRGQRAKFLEEIYRDWIIPDITKEILKGKKFLATLSTEEMSWVAGQLAENYANHKNIEEILDLKLPTDKETLKQEFREKFSKTGNKQLLEILRGEFKDIEMRIGVNIAGKQKDLASMNDKLLSIFQFVFANPAAFQQAMQIPALAKAFQDILEYSGVSSGDFSTLLQTPTPAPVPIEGAAPQPLQLNQPVAV